MCAITAATIFFAPNAVAKPCWGTTDDADAGMVTECRNDAPKDLDGGGAEPPPPSWPQPPIPEPIDIGCEACTTPPTKDELKPLPFPTLMWSREMEKLCGPGQSLGFSLTGDLEGSTEKAPCSCYEKSYINVGIGGSLQVCKYGGEFSGRYEKTSVACQTPECSEDTGAFSCREPAGTHTSLSWSARGGVNFQIP